MTRLTNRELVQKLKEQRDFLSVSLSQYEAGKKHFAYLIAVVLRTLFYEKGQKPILPDLAERYGYKFELMGPAHVPPHNSHGFYFGFPISFGPVNRAVVDNSSNLIPKTAEQFWNEIVYSDPAKQYKRCEVVLLAANKLGGAHVQQKIDPTVQHLSTTVVRQSGPYSEELIITSVVHQSGVLTLRAIDKLLPYIEEKIADEERGKITVESLANYVLTSTEVQYWNDYLRNEPTISRKVESWGDLTRDIRIAEFCGLHSIEEIGACLRQAHGWGEMFLKLYYQKRFGKPSPGGVVTLNGSITFLLIASFIEKFTPEILDREFGFYSAHIHECVRAAREMSSDPTKVTNPESYRRQK